MKKLFLFACIILSAIVANAQCTGFSSGTLPSSFVAVCPGYNPATISFSSAASNTNPGGGLSYQWYSLASIPTGCPSGTSTANWVLIPGATSATYDPPAISSTVTYACFVTPTNTPTCSAKWATGCIKYRVMQLGDRYGKIVDPIDTICIGGTSQAMAYYADSDIPISVSAYQWYYKEGINLTPFGNSTTGWTLITGATSWLYIPDDTLYSSRTYSVFITPNGSSGCSSTWAGFTYTAVVIPVSQLNYGAVDAVNQTVTPYVNVPDTLEMSVQPYDPSDGFYYAWYYKDGLHPTPSFNSSANGWHVAYDGTGFSLGRYLPPADLQTNRTYALRVTPAADYVNCGYSHWAAGSIQINIATPPVIEIYGEMDPTIDTLYSCDATDTIHFLVEPTPIPGGYTYTWYNMPSTSSCPTQDDLFQYVTSAISSGPENYLVIGPSLPWNATTYVCKVHPNIMNNNTMDRYITGCKQYVKISGYDSGWIDYTASDTTCVSPTDPDVISLTLSVSSTIKPSSYQWYYKDGINDCPTLNTTTGWTLIPGATGMVYDPPAGLTHSRTYACYTTPSVPNIRCQSFWADNCVQQRVATQFDYGTVEGGNIYCPGQLNKLKLAIPPSNDIGVEFSCAWYYKDTLVGCPTGNSLTGWTYLGSALNDSARYILGADATGPRTYACMAYPENAPTCGRQWASGCRKVTINNSYFNPGTLTSADEFSACAGIDPAPITFSTMPSGGTGQFTYQWYKNGLVDCNEDYGWVSINGATSSTYDPPNTATSARYKCKVGLLNDISCNSTLGLGLDAANCRKVTIGSNVNYGVLDTITTYVCVGQVPAPFGFSVPPQVGQGSVQVQWYTYVNSVYIPIPGATSLTCSPPAITQTTTYYCYVTPTENNGCTGVINAGNWANYSKKVVVNSVPYSLGTISSGTQVICDGSIPATITTSVVPGVGPVTYQWYYKEGTSDWILIPGATNSNYVFTAPLAISRTYACYVTPTTAAPCYIAKWLTGTKVISIQQSTYAPFNAGTITSFTDTVCSNANHAAYFTTLPTGGAGNFTYTWYRNPNVNIATPTGSVIDYGWEEQSYYVNNLDQAYSNLQAGYAYACYVTPQNSACDTYQSQWASGIARIIPFTEIPLPTQVSGTEYYCSLYASFDPAPVSIAPLTPQQVGKFSYQWYYSFGTPSTVCAATQPTSGYYPITGATGLTYDPDGQLGIRTFKCLITPLTETCRQPQFAVGCITPTVISVTPIHPGEVASHDENICPGGDPFPVFLSALPTNNSGVTLTGPQEFKWYYKDGINTCPTGNSTTGWTVVSGADSVSIAYDPPAGLSASRTYACLHKLLSNSDACTNQKTWADSCRKVFVNNLANINYGTLSRPQIEYCAQSDTFDMRAGTLSFAIKPSGGGPFTYQWYKKAGVNPCPTGSSTAGWTLIEDANDTTYNSYTYLDVVSTYACFVTPVIFDNCSLPGKWATSCSQEMIVDTPSVSYGVIPTPDQTICGTGTPSIMWVSQVPYGSYSYQWYYKDGLNTCPTGTSTTGWTSIGGAHSASYTPSTSITTDRTYACFIYPPSVDGCPSQPGKWASGCCKVDLYTLQTPNYTYGTLTLPNQTVCNYAQTTPLYLATLPTGGTSYYFNWYYKTGVNAAPTGTSTSGWTMVANNNSDTLFLNTLNTVTQTRTYACFATLSSAYNCSSGTSAWATGCVVVNYNAVTVSYGSIGTVTDTVCMYGNPDPISFTTLPSGSNFYYQWYMQQNTSTCPSSVSTMTALIGENGTTYDPPAGAAVNTVYKCVATNLDNCVPANNYLVNGCRTVLVGGTGNYTFNSVSFASQSTLCPGGDPGVISLQSNSSTYTYQWYYKDDIVDCPEGSSTTGWTLITGATTYSYNPPAGLQNNRTYACFSTLANMLGCPGIVGWASSCRKVYVSANPSVNFGTLIPSSTTQSYCGTADPTLLSISTQTMPSGGSGVFTYQWYYQDGIVIAPSGSSTTGWTLITGATNTGYDAPAGLTNSRTYACYVTEVGSPGACNSVSGWATLCGQITVYPNQAINYGTLASNNQTLCNGTTAAAAINFSILPSGNTFTYKWYYKDSIVTCPTGTSVTGWTLAATSNLASYSPGSVTLSRTYACFVTPSGYTGCSVQGQWANGCRQITVSTSSSTIYGTITGTDASFCNSADPAQITFSSPPSGGTGNFTYQWCYATNNTACGSGSANPVNGYITIPGATGLSYDPPAGLTSNRSYMCYITPVGGACNASPGFAAGCEKITVNTPYPLDAIVTPNQFHCGPFQPTIMNTSDLGTTQTYQWYYQDGLVAAPTGTNTNGWTTLSPNAYAPWYTPPMISQDRTYACYIVATSVNGACPSNSGWATGVCQIDIYPEDFGTLASGIESVCTGGNPSSISFTTLPSGGSGQFAYQWYYYNGIQDCPIDSTVGPWTPIAGATANTYDPPSGLTQSRTYACLVHTNGWGSSSCPQTDVWASGCRKVIVGNGAVSYGTLSSGDEILCGTGNPSNITFSIVPGGTSPTYQWYYQNGLASCPSGNSTTGWTLISGAVSASYDPPSGLSQSRTYTCLVTSQSQGNCPGGSGWSTQCRKVTINSAATFGALTSANETICSGGDPTAITFATTPAGGSGVYTYQWYYQDGLISCPSGSSTVGWTIISGATAATFDPSSGLANNRTYACLVTATANSGCTASTGWATQCRQVTTTTLPSVNYGTLASGNESFCATTVDPSSITFSTMPSGGSGNLTYQWYYQNGLVTCPTGTSTSGWTVIIGANASTYDPPSGLTQNRTYACKVIDQGNGICSGEPSQWAAQCRQVTVGSSPAVNYGTLASANESMCSGGDPANITFSTTPSGGSGTYTYQWYYQDGIITCPSGSSITGWTIISGATINSYNPPTGLTVSRTYACMVTNAANGNCPATSNWATQCRQVTINGANYGTIANGAETICTNGNPAPISFGTVPTGGGAITYQWYYRNGTQVCPTGTSTFGMVLISGATSATYDPPAGLNQTRTYACMVNIAAGNGCPASNSWATNCRIVTVTPLPNYGTLQANTKRICKGGDPFPLTFTTLPSGGTTYTYQWYYKNGQSLVCPSGTNTSGWTLITGATSSTYDPPIGLTTTRTYACMVTSSGSGTCSNGTNWAANCVIQTVVPPPTYGTLATGNENVCSGGNPAAISFSTAPAGYGTMSYQWYYKDGVTGNCPTGNSTTGWTSIAGATTNSYDPPNGLTTSRTYACLVTSTGTPCAASQWASNCRKVTIIVCREVDYIGFDNDLPQYDDNKGEGVNNQNDNTSNRPQMDGPVLEQNIPNPFTETTSITCILPKAYNSAHIRIVNVLGEEIMLKKLSSPGVNKIEVNRGTLIPGIYFYSLYLDGKLFETKRMVITY